MKTQEENKIDRFVAKVFKEVDMETPSEGFTDRIMDQIHTLETSKLTSYQPLISKKIWVLIGFGVMLAFVILTMTTTSESSWLNQIDLSVLTENSFTQAFSNIHISKTLMYTLVFLSLMTCIQIPILKSHFDKRVQY